MEDETASAMSLENVRSSAFVEASPVPENVIQETNVDLSMRESSTQQHPASGEVPIQVSEATAPKSKLRSRSMAQFMHKNWKTTLEMGLLIGTILIIWGLFSIPTILYALPPNVKEVHNVNLLCRMHLHLR